MRKTGSSPQRFSSSSVSSSGEPAGFEAERLGARVGCRRGGSGRTVEPLRFRAGQSASEPLPHGERPAVSLTTRADAAPVAGDPISRRQAGRSRRPACPRLASERRVRVVEVLRVLRRDRHRADDEAPGHRRASRESALAISTICLSETRRHARVCTVPGRRRARRRGDARRAPAPPPCLGERGSCMAAARAAVIDRRSRRRPWTRQPWRVVVERERGRLPSWMRPACV